MKNLKKEDLELMSYGDIAEIILKNEIEKQTTADLFKKICDCLELSKSVYENKIGDFYTALTTDKRFILLENGTWDLKENHSVKKLNLHEDFDDLEEIDDEQEIIDDNFQDEEKDIYDDVTDDDDDVTDEYKDLVIVDEDELESGE